MPVPVFPSPAPDAPDAPGLAPRPTAAAPRNSRRGRFGIDVYRNRLLDLQHQADLPQQRGTAGGRYHCPVCHSPLAFSTRRTCTTYTPRFTHPRSRSQHRCPAPAARIQAIRAGLALSTGLRERLAAACPDVSHHLEAGDDAYPPALVLHGTTRTFVIQPLLDTPDQDSARARVQEAYRRHGAETVQVWLMPWEPPDTAAETGASLQDDRAEAADVVVTPSPVHRAIARQGATVGWLDGSHLWLPHRAALPAGPPLAEAPRWTLARAALTELRLLDARVPHVLGSGRAAQAGTRQQGRRAETALPLSPPEPWSAPAPAGLAQPSSGPEGAMRRPLLTGSRLLSLAARLRRRWQRLLRR